ncbi:hypothetical protein EV359DRAFT_87223 [Lentinula novae-zelandiae]|nr:hypothetical protein EV359DRAFT_87223 [Lentinula novae-zelandiae]
MSVTSMERPSSSKLELKKEKNALSHGNTTQAQKSNQAASSTVITVAAGQRLMSIPEQLFGDETASNVRTPEGHQPAVQEPPPVDPGMGPPQWRYTSMGYIQPASRPIGGFTYSPTWDERTPPWTSTAARYGISFERRWKIRQQEKLPERRVLPAASEQSRASSRSVSDWF